MKAWIITQYIGAILGAVAGILIGMTSTTIFLQILGAVVFGFSGVVIAVLTGTIYVGEQMEEHGKLLRELRDRLPPKG